MNFAHEDVYACRFAYYLDEAADVNVPVDAPIAAFGPALQPHDATYLAERVWGISLRYDLGDKHPLVGRSVPDFELADGTKIGTLLSDGTGLFLDFDSRVSLRALTRRWYGRINYVAGNAKDQLDLSAVLVRPDGVVGWVSEGVPDGEEVAQAASRWFGKPEDHG